MFKVAGPLIIIHKFRNIEIIIIHDIHLIYTQSSNTRTHY